MYFEPVPLFSQTYLKSHDLNVHCVRRIIPLSNGVVQITNSKIWIISSHIISLKRRIKYQIKWIIILKNYKQNRIFILLDITKTKNQNRYLLAIEGFDALISFVMELDINSFILSIHHFESVRSVAIHKAVALWKKVCRLL